MNSFKKNVNIKNGEKQMVYRLYRSIRSAVDWLYNAVVFRCFGVVMHGKPGHIEGRIVIRTGVKGSIQIKEGAEFRSGPQYNIIGGDTRLCLRTISDGKLTIGKNVGISNSTIVSRSEVIIDDDVMIGGSCKIYDTDFHSIFYNDRIRFPDPNINSKRIWLKQGAFVGAHSIILKGVTIGRHSVIGAGSVVTKNVPDGEVWAGNPAKFVKKIEDINTTSNDKSSDN